MLKTRPWASQQKPYYTFRNWYDPHYSSLVEGITEPIAPFGNRQASFFLRGKEEDFRMFAVAVNKIGQPTILAGEYGKVNQHDSPYICNFVHIRV